MSAPSRHDPCSIQLSARVPRELHSQFYAACRQRGVSGSDMLRQLMDSFVRVTQAPAHAPA